MREIQVECTKAAYDRLFLMRDPDALAVPFDAARIAPFGVRVVDRNNRRHLEVTFRDQVVGVADRHAGDGFRVRLALPPSDRFDAALVRVFGILRTHLDQVGRVMAAELRQRKASGEYLDAQARRAKEQAEAEEKQARDHARHLEMMRQRNRESYDGLAVEGQGPVRIVLPGVTPDILELASKHHASKDRVRVGTNWGGAEVVRIAAHRGGCWFFKVRDGACVFESKPQDPEEGEDDPLMGFFPDAPKVAAEVIKIAERNARIADPAAFHAALAGLPAPKYALSRLLLSPPETYIRGTTDLCELDHGVKVCASYSWIQMMREGVQIASISVNLSAENPKDVFRCDVDVPVITKDELAAPALAERIVSLWAERIFPISGIALEPYAVFDMDAVEEEVANCDFGYDF